MANDIQSVESNLSSPIGIQKWVVRNSEDERHPSLLGIMFAELSSRGTRCSCEMRGISLVGLSVAAADVARARNRELG